jgi:tetrapyrrole methylase family protein/MazG family protein
MEQYPDELEIAVITGAGTSGQMVQWVPLHRLDRCDCDHLTTVYIPAVRSEVNRDRQDMMDGDDGL